VTLTPFQEELRSTSRWDFSDLRALYVNCTLKPSPELSHTEGLMRVSMAIMERNGVDADYIRAVDHDLAPGTWPDMREHGAASDEWPELYERVQAADILVIGSPIWLGEKSSVCTKRATALCPSNSIRPWRHIDCVSLATGALAADASEGSIGLRIAGTLAARAGSAGASATGAATGSAGAGERCCVQYRTPSPSAESNSTATAAIDMRFMKAPCRQPGEGLPTAGIAP